MDPQSEPNAHQAADTISLKKYGNRRLYDTSASRYVTLAEVEAMVHQGKDIIVVDAKTGADLTKSVLLQLILDGDGARAALPTSLLQQAVRLAQSPLKDALVRAMQDSLDGFLSSQRAVVDAQRARIGQMGQMGPMGQMGQMGQMGPRGSSSTSNPGLSPSASPAMWNPIGSMTGLGVSPAPGSGPGSDLDSLKAALHETQALVHMLLEREVARSAPPALAPTTVQKARPKKKKAAARKKRT